MIKNDRQYNVTRKQAGRLRALRNELVHRLDSGEDELRTELELAAVDGELARMDAELMDYAALKEGLAGPGVPRSLEDVPRVLVRARIAAGLSQAALAERLALKEQQIQRYEATDYESASLSRLVKVARALNIAFEPEKVASASPNDVVRGLRQIGFEPDFVVRRFGETKGPTDVVAVVGRAARVLDCLPEQVVAGTAVVDDRLHAAAYKIPAGANATRVQVLAAYARFLAHVVRNAIPGVSVRVPGNPTAVTPAIHEHEDGLFMPLLTAVWNMGVPVIPLAEHGGFHAAVWSDGERPVVVLNTSVRAEAHWAFHLLHEVGHIVRGDHEVVEGALTELPGDAVEREVNEWASQALLGGRGDELFDEAVKAADGNMKVMQRAVRKVARVNGLDIGVLALHVAFRLSERGENWWGAASNMVEPGRDPWRTARDILIDRVDWSAMAAVDADLLARAVDAFPPGEAR